MSSTATIMLPTTPSIICSRVSWRKSRGGGAPLFVARSSGGGEGAGRRAGRGRPSIVVDQNVGVGAGRKQRLLAFRRREIGGDRSDLHARGGGDLLRGRFEPRGVASVDDDLAAGGCESAAG